MKSKTPARDVAIRRADCLNIHPREVWQHLTPAEQHAVAWEMFARGQAEVDAGRAEPIDAVIERGIASAELAAAYEEIAIDGVSLEEVPGILRSLPSGTSVVVAVGGRA